jgi:heavy metal sensor kinase
METRGAAGMICLSLKWRVSLWVTTVLVAVIATISIVAYVEFEESHLREIDRTLLAMANGILASLDSRVGQEELVQEVRAVTAASGPKTASFSYRIWMEDSSADLLASDKPGSEQASWLHRLGQQNAPAQGQYVLMNIGRPGNEYRAVWMRHIIGDPTLQKDRKMGIPDKGIVNIVVAGSSHFTFHELHEFLRMLLILGTSLIIGSVVAIMWTVRCGLLPVDTTAKKLQHIGGHRDLGSEISLLGTHPNVREAISDEKRVPTELRPFVRALNDMLDRLDNFLHQQKQFTSDAAHELRTPLAGAKSTLQAAQMHQRHPDEYRRAIHDALEDLARMERLIEQLLILARMDEVNAHSAVSQVDLNILLHELVENYDKKARQVSGRVTLTGSSAATVRGDMEELARLFNNVIDNAVRYGPTGGTVSVSIKCEPDGYATVAIHDEGGNIPADAIPRLFDRFYRVDHSRSSSTGGAGLGLAIARQIARRHNGDISITSSPGSGTLVSIRLPLTDSNTTKGEMSK